MRAKSYTIVHVPKGTVTRLTVSEDLIRQLVAEYGAEGWRVCRMGDVIVLHSQRGGRGGGVESTPAAAPEDSGSTPDTSTTPELTMGRLCRAFEWLRKFGRETDDLEEADHCESLLSRLSDLERIGVRTKRAAGGLEHSVAELLHDWKNGIETTPHMWERVDNALDAYREEVSR